MTVGLLYHRITADTGKLLADELGCEGGEEFTRHHTHVIRWGNGGGLGYTPRVVVNKQIPLGRAIDKNEATRLFQRHGVRCPTRTTRVPCVGRSAQHTQGQNFWLCWEPGQVETASQEGAAYFISYIPIKQEFRVHVIDGAAAFVQRKYARTRVSTAFMGVQGFRDHWHERRLARNQAPADVIGQAIAAVECLGLDFGGVDVVISIEDDHAYVLEVNTGPALPTPETREPYIRFFRSKIE